MGAGLLHYQVELVKERMGVYGGKIKNWRRCRLCGKKMREKDNDITICVHTFGETPTYFHPECAFGIAAVIHCTYYELTNGTQVKK